MNCNVPEIDILAGISCYCTSFDGIGGCIKSDLNDFIVSEIINPNFLNALSQKQTLENKFPVYVLKKKGIDTPHAILEFKKKFGLNLKFLGLKDAKALTEQYVSCQMTKTIHDNLQTDCCKLKLKGFSKFPLDKSILFGNRFNISVKGSKKFDTNGFVNELENVGNFYGLQRFGSERMVSHLVGKEILKKNYSKAIKILLCHTSKYDSKFSKEIRESLQDERNYTKILKIIPKGMDIEKSLIFCLVKDNDPIFALRSLPLSIRRIFIQAYQAFLFNKCLGESISLGESIQEGKHGDIGYEINKFEFGKIKVYEPVHHDKNTFASSIRLVGYASVPKKSRFDLVMKKILYEEDISPKNFYIKDLNELSEQGGFRPAKLFCKNFKYSSNSLFSFDLPKGSYATTLLREIMKPVDPIMAGF